MKILDLALLPFNASRSSWWWPDSVGLFLAIATISIGFYVCIYAATQFRGESRSFKFVALAALVIASIVATDLSNTLAFLYIGWVLTSITTVILLWQFDFRRWRQSSAKRALLVFGLVDLILGIAVLAYYHQWIHDPAWLIAAVWFAAAGRAGLITRRSWVVATINTPTPVSALLHAGVVNAGAILIYRANHLVGDDRWIRIVAAGVCISSLIALAPRINHRADLKGQLAASTVSQMAFMLFAIACGWPLLAFTHLIGHGIYKAGRFMGSGSAIWRRARLRRFRGPRNSLGVPQKIVGALFLALVSWGLGYGLDADARVMVAVFVPAVIALWWSWSGHRNPRNYLGALFLGAVLVIYGGFVDLIHNLLGNDLHWNGWQCSWWFMGAVVIGLSAVTRVQERIAG